MTRSLRGRIVLTLTPILALLLAIGIAGVVLLSHLGGRTNAILRENYDSVIAMERLREATERIDSSYQFTLSGEEAKARAQYQANWTAYRDALRFEQGNITVPGEKELVEELTALTEQYQQQGDAFYASGNADARRQAYYGTGGLLETFTQIKAASGRIAQINHEYMEESSRKAKRTAWWSLFGFAIGLALTLILASFAAWYIFSTILGPVRAVTQSARGVSVGKLDQVVPYLSSGALGELADAFNQMTQSLREKQQTADERTQDLLATTETLRRELGEREKMEQSLRQMASIVESSDDAIFSRGPDGTIASWNKGAERLFGYPAQAVLGQSQFMLVPAEYQSELTAMLERVHRGEHVAHFETVRRKKDGERVWVSLTCFPIHDETGTVVSVASIVRDITERKRAEEQLRRANAYNRSLIEASLDPLVTIGLDGKITDVNAATEAATGHPRAELISTDFANYFTEPARAREGYQRVLSDGAVRDYPLEIQHPDGRMMSVLYNAAVYRDERGKVVGVFAAARDITERKRAEEQVRRLVQLQSTLADLGQRALRMTDSAGNLLNEAVALVARTLDVEFCNVAELLPGGERVILRAGVGWKEGLVGHATVTSKDSQAGFTIRSDRPVIVEDASVEGRFVPMPRLLGETTVSSMSVVVLTPEGPYGALGVHTRRRRTFTRDEVHFLQAIANVIGSMVHRQRVEDRLRRSNRALLALSSCNQTLIHAADELAILQQICQIIIEKAGYRLCWVGYAEHDEAKTVRPVAQAGSDDGYLKTVNVTWADTERGRGPTGTCIRTGRPVVFKNFATDPAFAPWRAEAAKRGYASSVAIPLITDATALGALTIYAAEPDAFGDEEVKLLTELAADLAFGVVTRRTRAERTASAAREAARQREIEIGSRIQQVLLLDQPLVDVPGLRIAAQTIPSRKIDGDFYSFYQHERRHLDVVVADVMGKGVPAALLGAATKSHLLEALCHLLVNSPQGKLPEPHEIITLANAEMSRHLLDLNSFVTLCYLRFDQDGHTLDFVDCGHTGLIHRRAATGSCEILHGDNLPLGFRAGEIYKQRSVPFEIGDLFLLFSDGITETRNTKGEFFGESRLLECAHVNGGLEPDVLVDAIRRAAFTFSGSEVPTDDWTCVAMKAVECEVPLRRTELDIRSDLAELRRVREFVRAACRDHTAPVLDEEGIGQLELAVNEACCNIIKHAYRGQRDQPINLEVEIYPNKVAVILHHLGEPFDPAKVPPPAFDGSRESGFGVYIIDHSVDTVRYSRDRGRNCVALVKSGRRDERK